MNFNKHESGKWRLGAIYAKYFWPFVMLLALLVTVGCGRGPSSPSGVVTFSASSLTFSSTAIGWASGSSTVSLSNTTSSPKATRIIISGTNAGDFEQTNTCGGSVSAGASCTVSVTFQPTAAGARTAILTSSATSQQVSLSGTGAVALVRTTVAVGGFPTGVAVDPTSNNVYVVNESPGSFCQNSGAVPGVVAWIDGTTDSVAGTSNSLAPFEISEPSSWLTAGPHAVAIDSAANTAYIAVNAGFCFLPSGHILYGSSSVVAFDLATQTTSMVWSPGTNSPGAFGFGSIGINQATDKIYAAEDYVSNNTSPIQVIDITTGSVTTLPDPGTVPFALAINAATNKTYVANFGSNNVTIIDGATGALSTVADHNAIHPAGIAVNQATNTIYVTNAGSNNVTVIDGQTDSIVTTIAVGTTPIGVAVDPQANFIYIANSGFIVTNSGLVPNNNSPGNLSVIDGATNAATMLTDPKAIGPIAVAINSATSKVYVANSGSNNVTVIEGVH